MKLVNILTIYLNCAKSKKILSLSQHHNKLIDLLSKLQFYPLPPPISPNCKLYSILGAMSLFINVNLKNGTCASTTSVEGEDFTIGTNLFDSSEGKAVKFDSK